MMRPGRATLILLPVLCLLCCGASRAATLGGLGGECNRQGGGKQTNEGNMVMIKARFPFLLGLSSLL